MSSLKQKTFRKNAGGKVDLSKLSNYKTHVVHLSVQIVKEKGPPLPQIIQKLGVFLKVINDNEPSKNAAILPLFEDEDESPPIQSAKDIPTSAYNLKKKYLSFDVKNATNELHPEQKSKMVKFSLRLGMSEIDIPTFLVDIYDDMKDQRIFVKSKPCQYTHTSQRNVILGIPTRIPVEEVDKKLQQIVKTAQKIAQRQHPDNFQESDLGVDLIFSTVRERPDGMPYQPASDVDMTTRQVYKIQCDRSQEKIMHDVLRLASQYKLLRRSFGPIAQPTLTPLTDQESDVADYQKNVLAGVSFNATTSYCSIPGVVNPTATHELQGLLDQVPPKEISLIDVIGQMEIEGEDHSTHKITLLFFNSHRHRYELAFLNDTRVQEYLKKWTQHPAANVFHYLRRRNFTKESIIAFLKKTFDHSQIREIDGSTYNPTTKLVSVRHQHHGEDVITSASQLGVDLSQGLTQMERELIGCIELPEGQGLSDIIESSVPSGAAAAFRSGDMSVRSSAKNNDGTSVKTHASLGKSVPGARDDDLSSIESENDGMSDDGMSEGSSIESVGDDVARALFGSVKEQIDKMDKPQKLRFISQLWAKHEDIFRSMTIDKEKAKSDPSVQDYFRNGDNTSDLLSLSYAVTSFSYKELLDIENGSLFHTFKKHYGKTDICGDSEDSRYMALDPEGSEEEEAESLSDEGSHSRSDASMLDVAEDSMGVYNSKESESISGEEDESDDEDDGKTSGIGDDEDDGNTSGQGSLRSACVNVQNESFYRALLLLSENPEHSKHQRKAFSVGAEAVKQLQLTITSGNVLHLGDKKHKMKVPGIGEGIARRLYLFARGDSIEGVYFKFNPPNTARQYYYNKFGPSTAAMLTNVEHDYQVIDSAIEDDELSEFLSLNGDILEITTNAEAIRLLVQTVGENLIDIRRSLNDMTSELDTDGVMVCPPFNDRFAPQTISEPPSSSATRASSPAKKSRQSAGVSVADGSEDTGA